MEIELQDVLRRVETLEIENRGLKRAVLTLALLAAVVFAMGQARPSRSVEANEFALKDGAGAVRARLHMDKGGPSLTLYDPGEVERADLMAKPDATFLILNTNPPSRFGGVQVLSTDKGGTLHLLGAKGSVSLSVEPPGPTLELADSEGYNATVGVSNISYPQTGEKHTSSAASIALVGKDKKILWRAP